MTPAEIIQQSELVNACKEGNKLALKKFYDRFAPVMYGICMRYTKNMDDAKDLLQDGFIQAFHHLPQFRNEGSLEGWLRRMFVNKALEKLRKDKTKFIEEDIEMADHKGVDGNIDSRISQQEIMEQIRKLAPGYQMVFNLFVIEGYSHAEIANMLGMSESTSKSQLNRARNILQKRITALNQWEATK
jgi:RNA polymerase sigma-70 factor (ECF subfamily)